MIGIMTNLYVLILAFELCDSFVDIYNFCIRQSTIVEAVR